MITGNTSVFAIESKITEVYEELHMLGLGFFVIHVGGYRYGVYEPDATALACSLGQIECRIADRGKHTAPFSSDPDAGKIAKAFRDALYVGEDKENESYFGISVSEFSTLISRSGNDIEWAPDGDEAFDDGSYVLQFDVEDRVRIIAYNCEGTIYHKPETLKDVQLHADEYYGILQEWHDAFLDERNAMLKAR